MQNRIVHGNTSKEARFRARVTRIPSKVTHESAFIITACRELCSTVKREPKSGKFEKKWDYSQLVLLLSVHQALEL
jgi:hypothetical protein